MEFPEIPEGLFIAKERPEIAEPRDNGDQPTALEALLGRDYDSVGYRDGYEIQDLHTCEARVKSIASEFRAAYREALDQIQERILKITPHMTDEVRDLMPQEYRKLTARHAHLLSQQASLQAEIDLSEKCEGTCETSLATYRLAFRRGVSDYFDDVIFFNR